MRSSIDKLIRALKADNPPKKIWQDSFDYIGQVKYHERLCHLNDTLPSYGDLINYSLDIQYMKVQPDLLRYLLPVCLNAWQIDLFSGERESVYGGFVEHFSTALAEKNGFEKILNKREHQAVMEFMCDSILDVMDRNNGLHFSGYSISAASPYRWLQAIGTFAVVFPNLERLWSIWWHMETRGHAIGVLQYISILMYEENINPIFDPWTHEQGGGPPSLFETEGFIYDQSWHPENRFFLKSILSMDNIYEALKSATQILNENKESDVSNRMINDFDTQKVLLESRLRQLPILLSKPLTEVNDWVE